MSPRDIAKNLAARRKRVSEYVKPSDGEPGPRGLARMFSGDVDGGVRRGLREEADIEALRLFALDYKYGR